ncbi:MAG: ABC transporter permease [Bacteroidales bacterium]|nr:MAG: ABC transporter permease [Bacteroidales bacterium]
MLKNFFLLAIRNYMRNKAFVVINVLGLGIAIGCCIVAYLNFMFDADYNKMHVNHESIYKVNISRYIKDRLQNYSISPISLAPAMSTEIAGIDRIVRYSRTGSPIRYETPNKEVKIFDVNVAFADKEFLRMFTFPLKWGDPASFEDEGKILLTEETSKKFFGDNNPVGESISLFNDEGVAKVFIVGGVFKKIPMNNIVYFESLTLYPNYLKHYKINELDWKVWAGATFLQVSNPAKVKEIEASLARYKDIQNKSREDWKIERYYIQSLKAFTKDSRDLWANYVGSSSHPASVIAPAIMAILILLLACFNFINTAIAISNKRLKEIGIRKVLGGHRRSLVIQFLGENFLICFLALLVSLLVGAFLIEEWQKMWAYEMISNHFLESLGVWVFLSVTLIFTAIVSALYPALYISSFNPIQVLKGSVKFSGNSSLSRTLLVLQFSISLISLISSVVFTQNAHFQNDFEYGYNKEELILVPTGSYANLEIIKKSLENNPGVIQMTSTSNHISWGSITRTATYVDQKAEVRMFNLYTNYCGIMDIKLVKGRDFTPEFEASDLNKSAIINESLVKEYGWDDPIGKTIVIDTLSLTVVGVVKDFYQSLWTDLMPMVFRTVPTDQLTTLIVKGDKNNLLGLNEQIKKEWEKLIPNSPYSGMLQVQSYEEATTVNKNILKIFNFLTIVAIFLSIVALYTLISLNILKRTKEVGIRKALGASSLSINNMIGKPFFIMLAVASLFGGAIGYYLSVMLLDSVWKIHIIVNIVSVLLPIIIMLSLAYATLSLKVFNTLSKNPISSLRYE